MDVGIDTARGDTFSLKLLPFRTASAPEPLPEPAIWELPHVLQWAQWGLAALLSLGVMVWLLRSARKAKTSLREALRPEPEEGSETGDHDEQEEETPPEPTEEIIGVVQSNPEAVGRLLRNWMYEAAK